MTNKVTYKKANYIIKRKKSNYLPEAISSNGKTYERVIGTGVNVEAYALKMQAEGKRVIILSVLSKNLKGRTDLYGKEYQPTKWVFVN